MMGGQASSPFPSLLPHRNDWRAGLLLPTCQTDLPRHQHPRQCRGDQRSLCWAELPPPEISLRRWSRWFAFWHYTSSFSAIAFAQPIVATALDVHAVTWLGVAP